MNPLRVNSEGAVRGRGVSSNLPNRFESQYYEHDEEYGPVDLGRPRTEFLPDASQSIIAKNDSPDVNFSVSVNPYRGCEHGCAYCFARPTHEYLGMSAGLDFETRIMVKEKAPELLRKALSSSKWVPQPIGMSGVTDPYQPIERKLELTRRCLEVCLEFRQPVIIITKNALVARDLDLLEQLAKIECAAVYVSLTTLDLALNRKMEPRTSSPRQRLAAMKQLGEAGVSVGTLVAPVIPGLNDQEIIPLVQAAANAGARHAGKVLLRLPWAVAPIFEEWLTQHYPDRKEKVLNRIRETRGGDLYDSTYGKRMVGEGAYAKHIDEIFNIACRKAGLQGRIELSCDHFERPQQSGDQLALFAK